MKKTIQLLLLGAFAFVGNTFAQSTQDFSLEIAPLPSNSSQMLLTIAGSEKNNPLAREDFGNCKKHLKMLVDVEESPDLTQGSWKKLYRAEVDADGLEVVVNKEGNKHFWRTRTLGYVLEEGVSMVCRHKKKGDELQCFKGSVPPGIEDQSTPASAQTRPTL